MRSYIKAAAPAGVASSGAILMKTGQTTSFAANDDGDLEAGRGASWFVLPSNNPFGNTTRFTDELGTQAYANNIIIDWSTYNGSIVLGWFKGAFPLETWAAALTNAAALSVGTFTTGWRIPNILEGHSSMNQELTQVWNWPPLSNTTMTVTWTSTTNKAATGNVNPIWSDGSGTIRAKTSTSYSFRCRNFTVTGTTLS